MVMMNYNEKEWYNVNFIEVSTILEDGILVLDKKGIIVRVNKKFLELSNLKEDFLIGKDIQNISESIYLEIKSAIGVLDGQAPRNTFSESLVQNRMHIITGVPFYESDGKTVKGMAIVIRDTTDLIQKQVELELKRKSEQNRGELEILKRLYNQTEIIGESDSMRGLKELIINVAPTEASVMITGETGCGKELVARAIHINSERKDKPYIKINCSAIPEQLLESELFGYEKGAFTGALKKTKLGLFEMANGGTILLDEIGDMPMHLQPKILRAIQEKEIMRLGGTEVIKLDFRILSSTNININENIKEKKFRADLYYRLNVVPIQIPPLRERKSDILLLTNHFLKIYNDRYQKRKYLSLPAIQYLERYSWPGNVRELENVIERLIVISSDEMISGNTVNLVINKKNYYDSRSFNTDALFDESVACLEQELIFEALSKHKSTYKAAEALGITQSKLVRKMKVHNIKL